jgi:CRP-like cAMP-binding protein
MVEPDILAELTDDDRNFLLGNSRRLSFNAGDYVYYEGDSSYTALIVDAGEAELRKKEKNGEVLIDILSTGCFFGEDCIKGEIREQSARAASSLSLFEIGKESFIELLRKNDEVRRTVIEVYKTRVIEEAIACSPLFRPLSLPERRELIAKFEPLGYNANFELISEGDLGDSMFLIKDGEVEVSTTNERNDKVTLATLGGGTFFGEVALVSEVRRTATVKTTAFTRVLKLTRANFQEITKKFPRVLQVANDWVEKRIQDTIKAQVSDDGSE